MQSIHEVCKSRIYVMRHESTNCLFNRLLHFRNLECDMPFVGSACKGENTEGCSFHLVPCLEEC
jgi:hypothetical protein